MIDCVSDAAEAQVGQVVGDDAVPVPNLVAETRLFVERRRQLFECVGNTIDDFGVLRLEAFGLFAKLGPVGAA